MTLFRLSLSQPMFLPFGCLSMRLEYGNWASRRLPILTWFKPITKYATLVEDPQMIRYELEKAVHIATSGSPGPVFVDIPDDLQRVDIDLEELESFVPEEEPKDLKRISQQIDRALELVAQAKRPILVLGAAIKIAKVEEQAKAFAERLQIPIALTWATMDMFPADHPLHTGGFGVSSTRRGNFAIQNSDLVFSIGSRLDTHATGTPVNTFAREAKKIVVDIDPSELAKFGPQGMDVDLLIQADVRDFFQVLQTKNDGIVTQDISPWLQKIEEWRRKYPVCLPGYYKQKGSVNSICLLGGLVEGDCRGGHSCCGLWGESYSDVSGAIK